MLRDRAPTLRPTAALSRTNWRCSFSRERTTWPRPSAGGMSLAVDRQLAAAESLGARPMQRLLRPMHASPRCGARTRVGGRSRASAMRNGRCRMHGGRSRSGTAHVRYRHGQATREALAMRRLRRSASARRARDGQAATPRPGAGCTTSIQGQLPKGDARADRRSRHAV